MKKWNKKIILPLLVCLCLTAALGIGSTLAYLTSTPEPVVNTFKAGNVPPTIQETEPKESNGYVKSNVRVTNNGNVPAYIRAAIIVTWQKDGKIAPTAPVKGTDYTMTIGSGWTTEIDGYYYYNSAVAAKGQTTDLITEAMQIKAHEDGYQLVIDIVAQTIQADGMGATSAQDAFAKAKGGS